MGNMGNRTAERLSLALILVLASICPLMAEQSRVSNPVAPAAFVQTLLKMPSTELDFARAKLAIDAFVDPSLDSAAVLAQIDGMVATVNKMLGTVPPERASTSMEKMKALQAFIYQSGHWNGGKPFQYDLSDPYGQQPGAHLLHNYLASRKGNCVSMPILFLALGERLGLNVTLSTAPLHIFVKWTDDETGKTWNLETTSGAGFTRDAHYRKLLPTTDEAVANGVYLKALSRQEALSVMATLIIDHLIDIGRYEEAIEVADVLIAAYPANAYALVKKGNAYYRLLEQNIIRKYPKQSDIPPDKIAFANELYRANQEAFAQPEALGWREPTLD
jgi:regulator of sirC expression with transglutaminase-like and TPR domain